MTVTITEIVNALRDTFKEITSLSGGLGKVQGHAEMTPGVTETPTLQIYWYQLRHDPSSQSAQTTFGGRGTGNVQQKTWEFRADLYAKQRGHIAEALIDLSPIVTDMDAKLESEVDSGDIFGLSGKIKAIEGWEALALSFEVNEQLYAGARFRIMMRTF